MLKLTQEQHLALAQKGAEPIRLIDPVTQEYYVLVPAGLYERMNAFVSADTVFTTAEMLDRVMAEDDANDPYLADLQKKYGGKLQ